MSRASAWLLYSLPVLVGCGAAIEPVSAGTGSVSAADASVTIPNIGPLNGGDAGVSQTTSPSTTGPGTGADGGPPEKCEIQTIQTTPSVSDMMIVLDRSGSMNRNPMVAGSIDRWGGSRTAISAVVQDYDTDIHFGLMTFPENGNANTCAAGTVNVPIGMQTGDQIALTLGGITARGNTPTASTLEVARTTLGPAASGPDIRPVPKYVLLVTDGDPNCSNPDGSGSGSGVDQAARDATISEIKALAADGIKTYVVGFETAGTSFEEQLNLMAQAGDTGATTHRSVSSGDDLAAALKEVISMVTSCEFSLNKPVVDASYVAVTIDGKTRALGRATDGFDLGADKQTVTLTGDACTAIKNGSTLQIEVRCVVVSVN